MTVMPRLAIQDGPAKIHDRLYDLRPDYRDAHWMMLDVLEKSILETRLKELVRYRVVQLNGCALCMSNTALLPDEDYAALAEFATSERFDDSDKVAIEYAERFVLDHHGIDDDLWERLHAQFSDEEILDLTFVLARYIGASRLTHVLGLDDTCPLQQWGSGRDGRSDDQHNGTASQHEPPGGL
jgi:hypothetical protein